MRELSKAEETFLVTIGRLNDNAYGVSIRDKIAELTGKVYTYGTLYGILDQLVNRGYAVKFEGAPTSERGGRRKLYYKLTADGITALKTSYQVQKSLWGGIDMDAIDEGFKV